MVDHRLVVYLGMARAETGEVAAPDGVRVLSCSGARQSLGRCAWEVEGSMEQTGFEV